jgi:copper chaperone CopZ
VTSKTRFVAIVLVTLALLAHGASVLAADAKTATLGVEGMTCGGCAASVKIVLKKLDGVSMAMVSFAEKKATVTYDPAKVTPQQMADAIAAKLGYKAKVVTEAAKSP